MIEKHICYFLLYMMITHEIIIIVFPVAVSDPFIDSDYMVLFCLPNLSLLPFTYGSLCNMVY
jgi:hypothetical protein